jgi:AAHS family 4-hydroxybenzoate transporter-like MFS transporter
MSTGTWLPGDARRSTKKIQRYETSLRATGVGWAIGIGRIGSIVGPVSGGMLIAAGTAAVSLFILVGTMSIGSAIAIVALGLCTARRPVTVQ